MPLTLQELKSSRSLLGQAHVLVGAVRALFFGAGEADAAARLNDIAIRIDDEGDFIDRLILATPGGEK